jgi:hypothetical protein
MGERQHVPFSGTILHEMKNGRMHCVQLSESSVCFNFPDNVATVEPHDGGVTVSVATHGDPMVKVEILLDAETAKQLGRALLVVAFDVDPEPVSIGVSNDNIGGAKSMPGDWDCEDDEDDEDDEQFGLDKFHGVSCSTPEKCLIGFARSFGRQIPRPPIPLWWDDFEAWYQRAHRQQISREQCLRDFVANPLPSPWWESFDVWYQKICAELREYGAAGIVVKTEQWDYSGDSDADFPEHPDDPDDSGRYIYL